MTWAAERVTGSYASKRVTPRIPVAPSSLEGSWGFRVDPQPHPAALATRSVRFDPLSLYYECMSGGRSLL